MRVVIQRVSHASVTIEGVCKSAIKEGFMILVGIEEADTQEDADWLCKKIIGLRVFDDENGVMNKSILEVGGNILVISQFTLHASTKKGNRPSYIRAAKHDVAIPLYNYFCQELSIGLGKEVGTGEFGADMKVGIEEADTQEDADWLCKKIIGLRVFDDENGVMNKSILEVGGNILVISQFTLHASTKKGNRPSYIRAAKHDVAIPLYNYFCQELSIGLGKEVGTGEFGADMKVELLNNGPVTICMDTKNKE